MTQKLVVSAIKILTAVFILCNSSGIAQTALKQKPTRPILMTNQIEVQFETDVDLDRIGSKSSTLRLGIPTLQLVLDKYQIKQAKKMFPWRKGKDAMAGTDDMSKFLIVSLPENSDIYSIIDDLEKNPYIRSVSPIWAMPIYEVIPDDPKFGGQWGLNEIGAKDVWEIEKGSDTAIVAVVDVGVLYTHPDLEDNIWVNPGEDLDHDEVVFDLGDVNGFDDDGNGLADDLIGYDFFTGVTNSDPWPGEDVSTADIDPKDFNGHGTHVAGIASAVANNNLYGAGLAGGWGGGNGSYRGPRIMCIRVGGSYKHPDNPDQETGYVNTANCAQGVDYAARMGACVVNCSWGFSNFSAAMEAAGLLCNQNNVIVLHAAGNEDEYSPNGGYLDDLFLGSPPMEVALSVAATAPGGYRASFSNYGEYIDICAPGENIYSTYSDHYGPSDAWIPGTSMATPFVAGLVALIKSHMPHYTKPEITALILDNAVDIDAQNPGYEGLLGSGLIDAYASMANLPIASFEAGPELLGPAPLEVDFTDLSPNNPFTWEWDFGDGGNSTSQNPTYTYENYGLYSVALTVDEPKGTATEVLKNLVMVTADTIRFDSIRISTSGTDQKVVMPVLLNNKFLNKGMTIQFQIKMNGENVGYRSINFDSISTVGCRTDNFESISISPYDRVNSRYGVLLLSDISGGSNYLQPGQGAIVNIHLDIDYSIPDGTIFTFDSLSLGGAPLRLTSPYGVYYPEFISGKIFVKDEICGDLNKDLQVNILDVVYLINYKFKNGPPPEPVEAGDFNSDGEIDINDIVAFINYKYKDGPDICGP